MSSFGSQAEAYDTFDAYGNVAPRHEAVRLDVIAGGGLDARVRRGVSPSFVFVIRMAAIAIALFVMLGVARVAITTSTIGYLNDNISLRTSITQMEQANSDLKIERSVLSSSARITRIATENYGMVLATTHDRIALPTPEMRQALDARAEAAEEVDGAEPILEEQAPETTDALA